MRRFFAVGLVSYLDFLPRSWIVLQYQLVLDPMSKDDNIDNSDAAMSFRTEHDSMGDVKVPASALWGAQTQRAVDNFPISNLRLSRSMIWALATIKAEASKANQQLGVIDSDLAVAISETADAVAEGRYDNHFPVDVFQTGSGTSSNMNMNEVIAHLASAQLGRDVLPNDHVNASQSSNDVFPTAIHLASAWEIKTSLIPSLEELEDALREKSVEFSEVVKAGRTHLMDATPITLGQEFSGYAAAIEYGIERLLGVLPRVCEVPLGGTAVGTGLNAPRRFAELTVEGLARRTELPMIEARNHFEAHGSRDSLVELSGVLKTVAISMYKVANDLRLMSSGPMCGLREIHLPDLQPGSSIMPGKVNPVVPEAVCQVVAKVVGNDATVSFGGAAGTLELNVMLPVIALSLVESIKLLASVSTTLASKCILGITADEERCRHYALSSPSIATSLNPYLGYETVARIVKRSLAEGVDLRSLVLEEGLMSESEVDRILNVMAMTQGGILK